MTNQQGTEALRLADEFKLCNEYDSIPSINDIAKAAAELRRLHAYCQELESQVFLDCMTHVQKPTEIERVAGDVSKNGPESNMAQQPAPSAAAAEGNKQKESEMKVWFRPARMHGQPERTPIKATITKDRGNGIVDLTFDDEGVSGNARAVPNALRLPRNVREQVAVWWDVDFEMDFQTAVENSLGKKKESSPQPSPTPQADATHTLRVAHHGQAPAGAAIARVVLGVDGKPASEVHLIADGDELDVEVFDAAYPQRAPHRIANLVEQPTAQADSQPCSFGSPELQAMILAKCVEKDRAARAPADSVTPPAGGANWQDISTAPKDGTRFVAVGQNYGLDSEKQHTCIAQWLAGCWVEVSEWNGASKLKYLTHWMPLPPLPGSAARAPADSVTAPAAFQRALDIRTAQGWKLGGDKVPVLYTDTINGKQVCRDDLWLCTTAAFATPPAQTADSVLEDAARLDWLLLHISGAEFRRIGVHYSGNARRADVDAARKQGGAT